MKRLLYFMIMAAVVMTGCTKWDEPITENYGDGPSINVSITALEPTDSAFTITITPGEGTTYYAFVIDANDEAEELDAATLLRGGYGNSVVNTEKYPTLAIPVTTAEPNTTYQVYAVASNKKGIVGKIAVASIKTTDSGQPDFQESDVDAAGKKAVIAFDQAISRGEGKVSAVYFSEFDFANPVAIDDVEVTISGNSATLTAPSAPAGSYLMFSWEKGAFVDAVGNKCAAFTSTINEAGETVEDIFENAIWVRVKNEEWAITDACFTAPKVGGTFPNWKSFEGEITFENKVYVLEDEVETGDFTVTYSNDSRTVTYKLPVENINFGLGEDLGTQKVTFKLPEATQPGDEVTVAIKEGVFYDVNGNTNSAFSSPNVYWIAFSMTKDDFIGDFSYVWVNYSTGAEADGSLTISENPEEENGIIINGLWGFEGLEGYYSIEECKIYLYNQPVGVLSGYYATIENAMAAGPIPFAVNANGTIVCETIFGLFGYTADDYSDDSYAGAFQYAASFVMTKSAAAQTRSMNSAKEKWSLTKNGFHKVQKIRK